MAFNTGGRKCKFESLENRQMMAGDVFARTHAGTLIIKGDNLSNGITIAPTAVPFQVMITGTTVGGSATNVNGVSNAPVLINNVTAGLQINMKGGNDEVTTTFTTVNALPKFLTINGKSKIKGGAGLDTIDLTFSQFNSKLNVQLGPGSDALNVSNTTVQARMNVTGGANFDNVSFLDSAIGELNIALNEGNDNLAIENTQVVVQTTINGGKGVNSFVNGQSNFFGSSYTKKNLNG
jgi:hypothetical protein